MCEEVIVAQPGECDSSWLLTFKNHSIVQNIIRSGACHDLPQFQEKSFDPMPSNDIALSIAQIFTAKVLADAKNITLDRDNTVAKLVEDLTELKYFDVGSGAHWWLAEQSVLYTTNQNVCKYEPYWQELLLDYANGIGGMDNVYMLESAYYLLRYLTSPNTLPSFNPTKSFATKDNLTDYRSLCHEYVELGDDDCKQLAQLDQHLLLIVIGEINGYEYSCGYSYIKYLYDMAAKYSPAPLL